MLKFGFGKPNFALLRARHWVQKPKLMLKFAKNKEAIAIDWVQDAKIWVRRAKVWGQEAMCCEYLGF